MLFLKNLTGASAFTSAALLDWLLPLIIAIAGITVLAVSLTYKRNRFTTKDLTLAAVCIGMSFGLSYWKVWENPQGGSITVASMLPIMLFAYIAGFRKGLIAGIAYGILQLIQDPWLVHPAQALLDYILGFGAIALAGVFKNIKAVKKFDFLMGIVTVGVTRFFFSLISGVIFFAEYTWEGWGVWAYSAAYNSVLLIDSAICLGVAVFMQYSPHFRRFMNYMDDGKNFKLRRERAPVTEPCVNLDNDADKV